MTARAGKSKYVLLPAVVLLMAFCVMLPQETLANRPSGYVCSAGLFLSNVRCTISWLFAAFVMIAAIKNFRVARTANAPANCKKISIDVLAAIALVGLPFLTVQFSPLYDWAGGLVVSLAGGWLGFRLLRSKNLSKMISTVCAICFAVALSWPLAYVDYKRIYPNGIYNGTTDPCALQRQAREATP